MCHIHLMSINEALLKRAIGVAQYINERIYELAIEGSQMINRTSVQGGELYFPENYKPTCLTCIYVVHFDDYIDTKSTASIMTSITT